MARGNSAKIFSYKPNKKVQCPLQAMLIAHYKLYIDVRRGYFWMKFRKCNLNWPLALSRTRSTYRMKSVRRKFCKKRLIWEREHRFFSGLYVAGCFRKNAVLVWNSNLKFICISLADFVTADTPLLLVRKIHFRNTLLACVSPPYALQNIIFNFAVLENNDLWQSSCRYIYKYL